MSNSSRYYTQYYPLVHPILGVGCAFPTKYSSKKLKIKGQDSEITKKPDRQHIIPIMTYIHG
jgi:hypothetical protein